MESVYTINSRRFDGSIKRSWQCRLLEMSADKAVFVGTFDRDLSHEVLGDLMKGTISYEYYWWDKWYNVFRFHNPDGTFRNYYCNINKPPKLEGLILDYVDLEIDIMVGPKGDITVLDEDEFSEAAETYNFSDNLIQKVDLAVAELKELAARREFPFDHF